jgi:hypothetical protein
MKQCLGKADQRLSFEDIEKKGSQMDASKFQSKLIKISVGKEVPKVERQIKEDQSLDKEREKKYDYSRLENWLGNPLKIVNIWKENQDDLVITLFCVGAYKMLHRDEEAVKLLKEVDKVHQIPIVDGLICYLKQQYGETMRHFQKSNDPIALLFIGRMYYFGEGVSQDYKEAAKWYQKAADQRSSWAEINLGSCYEYGQGVNQDYKEAVKWYQKSADQGNSNAQSILDFIMKMEEESIKMTKKL